LRTVERKYIDHEERLEVVIQAKVVDTEGNPMAGRDVNFSTDYGSLSTYWESASQNSFQQKYLATTHQFLSTVFLKTAHAADNANTLTVQTDDNGKASAVLSFTLADPQPEVIAQVTKDEKTVNDSLRVYKATKLTLEVTGEQSIPADGISSTQIQATLFNEEGDPLPGVHVTFDTNNGSLQPQNATTNSKGQAQISLIAATSPGQAQVTAHAEGLSDLTEVIHFLQSRIGSIELEAGTKTLVANGRTQTTLSALVKNSHGNLMPDGTFVSFSTTAGTLSSETARTTNGIANVTFTSSTTIGTVTIKASSGGIITRTAISLIPGPVDSIELFAEPNNLTADGVSTSTIEAQVLDAYNNPVANEDVLFSASAGSLSSARATTNTSGIATVTFTTPKDMPSSNAVTITATSANGRTDSTPITLINTLVGSVSLESGATLLEADGKSSTRITAVVLDRNGNPVPDNTRVSFSATSGSLSSEIALTQRGIASVTFTSSTTIGTVTIKVSAGGIVERITISLISGSVDSIQVSADPNNLTADGVSTSTIEAHVLDAYNNPVANEDVLFSASAGSLSSARATTNTSGIATVTFTVPGEMPTSKALTITATTANGRTDSTTIDLIEALVGSITLEAGTDQLEADGKSSTRITAEVFDRNGNHVPDNTLVTFSTTAGTLSSDTATTTQGIAAVQLTSPVNAGTGTISATAGGIAERISVTFIAGTVTTLQVLADPNNITADGQSTSTIEATALDASNNPVANQEIKFSVDHGSLSNLIVTTNANGRATTIYTAPDSVPASGQAVIHATSVNNVSSSVTITIISVPVGSVTLEASPTGIPADGNSTSNIKATVLDTQGNPVKDGTVVSFSTTGGRISQDTASTLNGQAQVILTSSTTPGTIVIKATAGGMSSEIQIEFTSIAAKLSLATSQTQVKTDNSDAAEITATVLNNNNAPVEGVTVNFQSTGGKISASSVNTNADGEAKITFSSGTADKTNQVVTIQANVINLTQTIPIEVYGTSLTLSPERTHLGIPDTPSDNLNIRVQDAGNIDVYDALVTARVEDTSTLRLSNATSSDMTQVTGRTDVTGELTIQVKGTREGNGTVIVKSLGTGKEQIYSVTSSLNVLTIIDPSEPLASAKTDDGGILIKARSSNGTKSVTFATTSGKFTAQEGSSNVLTLQNFVTNGTFHLWNATLKNNEAGLANVEVYKTNAPSEKDTVQVAFSAPTEQAGQLILQTSATNVQPSFGNVVNTVDLEAQVKTSSPLKDAPVGGAPVLFSITNPTGGGEYISPTLVYTDNSGIAKSIFTSGSLSSGAKGVTIRAEFIENRTIHDTANIIIGGTVGSISIGYGTKISSIENDTAYSLPMSVLVTDSNGNAMNNVRVSLSTWPVQFRTGYWTRSGIDLELVPLIIHSFPNEDQNRNLIRDIGDLKTPLCNSTCSNCYIDDYPQLTPPQSAGGNLPSQVTTNKDGVANFNLTYLKKYAIWTIDEITASAQVLGTETTSQTQFGLPYAADEKVVLSNAIPNSPFNPECLQ
jgi:hypothetical protein